jgi:hypothetical protein
LSSAVTTGANELTRDLLAAYDEVYLDRDTRSSRPPAIGELVPSDARALYLQRRYSVEAVDVETGQPVVGEPEEGQTVEIRRVEEPGRLDDAGDGSDWSAVHARFHPVYRRVVDELELLDLYLIEPTDSRIVYSVEKRPDLGTSLVGGPFGGTVLATTAAPPTR